MIVLFLNIGINIQKEKMKLNKLVITIALVLGVFFLCACVISNSVQKIGGILSKATKQSPQANTQLSPVADKGLFKITTQISPNDSMPMVYVPSGEFLMGSLEGVGEDNEHPQHTIYLDAYWIDKTEVTNAMYAKCVSAGICTDPLESNSITRSMYYGNPEFDNYPVINVNWNQALAYCNWVGRSLPTEAEWEKAARGTDGRIYPWGNKIPDNIFSDNLDTTEVGSFPDDMSPYGAMDMAGNVMEWVKDLYDNYYYQNSLNSNPPGPFWIGDLTGDDMFRVIRGGSFMMPEYAIRTTFRVGSDFSYHMGGTGFRCSLKDNNATTPENLDRYIQVKDGENYNDLRVAWSPDGVQLAVSSRTGIYFYDSTKFELLRSINLNTPITIIDFSPNGQIIASGTPLHGIIQLWDPISGVEIRSLNGHSSDIRDIKFSPNGQILVSTSFDGTVLIWDINSGTEVQRIPISSSTIDFSPDGLIFATSDNDKVIRLRDVESGAVQHTLAGLTNDASDIAFSPDGKNLASVGGDNFIRLWDVESETTIRTFEGHFDTVYCVAFSPDGTKLASGSMDQTVRIWDVVSGAELFSFRGSTSPMNVVFSPDGKRLASASSEGAVIIWTIP